jgi:superfamily II DNA or RNA helicase
MGLKKMIITNRKNLLLQWKDEIQKHTNLIPSFEPTTTVFLTTIQGLTCSKEKKNISEYNLVIFDELHNFPSTIFKNIFFDHLPMYSIGLTATYERKDGLHCFLDNHFTLQIALSKNSKKQQTVIQMVPYSGKSSAMKFMRNGNIAYSEMINSVCNDQSRNDLIVSLIQEEIKDPTKYILVVSDRKTQITTLQTHFPENSIVLMSNQNEIEKIKDPKYKIIFGISSMIKEGFSYSNLNVVLFATPKKDIVQLIGRIYRKEHTVAPKIIDIVDNGNIFKKLSKTRLEQYRRLIENPEIV